MRSRQNYFVFNKERDFARGYLEHMIWEDGGVWTDCSSQSRRCMLVSRILDSQEKDMAWHRLTFDIENQAGAYYQVMIFSSNTLDFSYLGKMENVKSLIEDREIGYEQKIEHMERFLVKRMSGQRDILLHDVCGRYLWVGIEIYKQESTAVGLKQLQVYFPRESWISYLPEVYQSNDKNQFLERYLAIFQTLHEDVNQQIRNVPMLIDPDAAGAEFLEWLAGWLDIAHSYMWSESQLRELVGRGRMLYERRGTRRGILEFIHLYTGGDAFLIEYSELERYFKQEGQKEILTRLYGLSPYVLSVMIEKEYVPTQKEYKSLIRVIEEMKPAQMELNLVVLEPYMFLNGHSYMGINSMLGEYRPFALDGLSLLPFSAIQNERST